MDKTALKSWLRKRLAEGGIDPTLTETLSKLGLSQDEMIDWMVDNNIIEYVEENQKHG